MTEPTFFVIGGYRCGTTTLCDLLGSHPHVQIADPKEPNFFNDRTDNDDLFSYPDDYDRYLNLWGDKPGANAFGEGTVQYSNCASAPEVAERMHSHFPDAKIVYSVRNPLDRLESQYLHLMRWRGSGFKFDDMFEEWDISVGRSMYWKQLQAYRKYFSDSQIRVVVFEDWVKEKATYLEGLFEFLGVDPQAKANSESHQNTSAVKVVTPLASRITSSAFYKKMKWLIPPVAREFLNQALRKEIRYKPAWNPEILAKAASELEPDAMNILKYSGGSPDRWSFGETDNAYRLKRRKLG